MAKKAALPTRHGPWLVILALGFAALQAAAQSSYPYMCMKAEAPDQRRDMKVLVPYALSTESLDFTLGLAWATTEGLRAPASLFSTAYYSANNSALLMAGARNVHVRNTERFFIDTTLLTGRQRQRRVYVDGNALFPDTPSGSSPSDPDDVLIKDTWEARAEVFFKWVLPIGESVDEPIEHYLVSKGFLVSDPTGGSWLPWKGGRTTLSIRPQYWDQFIDPEDEDIAFRTLNAAFLLEYDNRDFRPNPARGGYLRGGFTYDPGWLDDTDDWSTIEGELSKYFWLGKNSWFRHQVLALNAWTMATPSWEESIEDGELNITGAAPYFAGPTLGGPMRLKAYPQNRFHDRAAVYYAAEVRMIPQCVVLPSLGAKPLLDIQWWQLALIGELGNVASEWSLDELHTDMKWDAGLGIRAMFGSAIGRMDFMYGEEGFSLQAMFGQSF